MYDNERYMPPYGPCNPCPRGCDPCWCCMGPEGPAGPTGPAGPAGPTGPASGLTNLVDGNAPGSVRGTNTLDDYSMHRDGFAIGTQTKAWGIASFAQGYRTFAEGGASHAEGIDTLASGQYSHAEGWGTKATDYATHAEGYETEAGRRASHAEGYQTYSDGLGSHSEGVLTRAYANYSHVEGYGNWDGRQAGSHTMGQYGRADAAYSWFLGNGTSSSDLSLAAKILQNGNAYIDVAWHGGGADYAEMFETESGQTIEPGYFVTFADAGDRIRIARSGDRFILGVVSRAPGFVAGAGELRWKGKFMTDEWGGIAYQDVAIPEMKDEAGEVLIPAHVESRPVPNPDYDPNQTYAPRKDRPEWVKVGLIGTLRVRDDGTLTPGGYCMPGADGAATAAPEGYRVLKRTGERQAVILFR